MPNSSIAWLITQFYATHRPARAEVTVPPHLCDDAAAREEMAFFEASVRTLDEAVGEVLETLEKRGLAENTLVLFTADHGIPFPRAKCSLYDPGLARVFRPRPRDPHRPA